MAHLTYFSFLTAVNNLSIFLSLLEVKETTWKFSFVIGANEIHLQFTIIWTETTSTSENPENVKKVPLCKININFIAVMLCRGTILKLNCMSSYSSLGHLVLYNVGIGQTPMVDHYILVPNFMFFCPYCYYTCKTLAVHEPWAHIIQQ